MIEILYKMVTVLLILSSLMVVFSYNSIYAVLFLILSYVLSAIILLVLKCEFIALILITIYVGAVAVLFLFVVLMLDIKVYSRQTRLFFYSYSIFLSFIFLIELLTLVLKTFKVNPYFYLMGDFLLVNNHQNLILKLDKLLDIEVLGQILSVNFVTQLLIAGLILFLGVVGSVVITLNFHTKKLKQQIFYKQFSKDCKVSLIF
jgi:NADH-quinone oxidoreductase subunit J